MYLIINRDGVREVSGGEYINIELVKLNCPNRLLSDSTTVVDELLDLYKSGYTIIVMRIKEPLIDPLSLGLNHMSYEAHYTRPVLIWVGKPGNKPIKLAKLNARFFGYRKYACQASALVVNKLIEAIGIGNIRVA